MLVFAGFLQEQVEYDLTSADDTSHATKDRVLDNEAFADTRQATIGDHLVQELKIDQVGHASSDDKYVRIEYVSERDHARGDVFVPCIDGLFSDHVAGLVGLRNIISSEGIEFGCQWSLVGRNIAQELFAGVDQADASAVGFLAIKQTAGAKSLIVVRDL